MKTAVLKMATAVAVAGTAVFGGAPAVAAATPVPSGDVLVAPRVFSGTGTGPTVEVALAAAVADAQAQAVAAGFAGGCPIVGDPIVQGRVLPGQPVSYIAWITIDCAE